RPVGMDERGGGGLWRVGNLFCRFRRRLGVCRGAKGHGEGGNEKCVVEFHTEFEGKSCGGGGASGLRLEYRTGWYPTLSAIKSGKGGSRSCCLGKKVKKRGGQQPFLQRAMMAAWRRSRRPAGRS